MLPRARKGPRPASHGPCCWRRLSPGPVSRPRSLRWLQPHTPTLRTAKVYFSQIPLVYSGWQWGGVLPSLGPQGHLVTQGTWPQRTHCICTEGATYPFCSHGPPSHARVQGTGVWADGSNDLPHGQRGPCWRQPRLPDGGGSSEQVERCRWSHGCRPEKGGSGHEPGVCWGQGRWDLEERWLLEVGWRAEAWAGP